MIRLFASDLAKIVNGKLYNLPADTVLSQIPCIDSRETSSENFFVAFAGQNVDGNDFALAALEKGASFALVNNEISGPCIVVEDTGEALLSLAAHVRSKLKELIVIGITGSQGKTTTKDILKHLLEISAETIAPIGNLNNEIGVPLTLLRCDETTKFCILEMGARHIGDIAVLTKVAQPNIGVVLSVGKSHIGEFGSRENIAKAKSELIKGLSPDSIAILGNYDEFTVHMADGLPNRKLIFGEKGQCDVRAADIELREGRAHFDLVTPEGRQAVSLQLLGLHQISNALAVAAIGTAIGIPLETIAAALSTAEPHSKSRMELHDYDGLLLINDAYNANPESMAAAMRTLALLAQDRGGLAWAFLGKMNELGESTLLEHVEIGRLIGDIGIDHLVCIGTHLYSAQGSEGEETSVHYCPDISEAVKFSDHFSKGDVVLVKASRSEHLDELAHKLLDAWKARST
jgi:UDP-N-acetylmuramoyl-tripeptide--D-alanyl-D-alanine ligase